MGINVKVGNSLLKFANVPAKLSDMTEVYKRIANLELSETKKRFVKEEGPDGEKWPEPFTLRRDGTGTGINQYPNPWAYVVASNYHATPPGYRWWARPDKILRDTGTLFNSFGIAYGRDYAIVGTNLEYARKHQDGIGVQQRRMLGINKRTEDNVRKAIIDYIGSIIK